ncbi:something about silencing, SAS, complex subunit 4-domain-containing protein [Bisporella sp. PMI_857]|nr:something about silencing, SAS, complex subunit 4-domain-containing protein [Bisporella sp. PMI_857]
MASQSLRSSKKSDGLITRSASRSLGNHQLRSGHDHTQQLSNIRKKRVRESTDDKNHSAPIKKPKLAVEILTNANPIVLNTDMRHRRSTSPNSKPPPKPAQHKASTPPRTNHQQKVVNGIKHELDRLQPKHEDIKAADHKRSLRSQEGGRYKSELSAYFPEYDEVIGNVPKEESILNYDTPIIVVDSAKTATSTKTNGHTAEAFLKEFPDTIFETLHNAERVDFTFLAQHYRDGEEDPLSDAYFESIHRKPERQEKAIRNTDKGRAQHEKDQVIRLLEGLQGHEWLKLMGVSGITESKRKDYEPARRHFITGCEMIIEKFRIWREEEKRRKLEKDQAKAESVEEGREKSLISNGDPPDYSDVDASAARQLHDEAIARCGPVQRMERRPKVEPISQPPRVEKDMKSFFQAPHIRDAALGKLRRSGRTTAAWGHPIPDVPSADFNLPEELRDGDVLRAHARQKRLRKRDRGKPS